MSLLRDNVVLKSLRKNECKRVFAGDETGNALVRSLLAVKGEISQVELSEPTEATKED